MKVVINQYYGGFGLSPMGLKRYLELQGKQAYFYQRILSSYDDDKYERIDNIENVDGAFFTCTTRNQGKTLSEYPEDIFYNDDIQRNDPTLIQVIEELGREASSKFSNLVVVEIENGRWFKIDEYDGYESIQYRDVDDEWMLAQ